MPEKSAKTIVSEETASSTEKAVPSVKARRHRTAVAEQIWRFLFILLVPIFYKVFTSLGPFHRTLDSLGIPHGEFSDLKLSVVAAVFFYFIRRLWERLTFPLVYSWIEDKHQGEERVHRARRVSKWIYDFFYYLSFTVFAYIHFKSIIPTVLLGDGTCGESFDTYPRGLQLKWAKEYYLVQIGNNIHKMVDQIFKKKNDVKFWEYFLHHCLAFCLMLHSYVNNYMHVGILILLTHDITDIFLSSMRAQEALKFKLPVIFPAYFIITYIVWTYCRGIVYIPCQVWVAWNKVISHGYHYNEDWFVDVTFRIQLGFLAIMNVFWIFALTSIAYKNLKHVSAKDILTNAAIINNYDPKLLKNQEARTPNGVKNTKTN